MNIFYPKIRLSLLPAMLGHAVLGALFAGAYGIIHDQVTYSISQEYFTCFKFSQFHYANFGFPPRVFVAEIGFLATWWVGFFAAWFIARITVATFPRSMAFHYSFRGFLIILATALVTAVMAYILSVQHGSDYSAWESSLASLPISDVPSFVRVAYIHYGSYFGGLVGLILAIFYLRKLRSTARFAEDKVTMPSSP